MICKLCKKDKKLIRAHAIPEAFFRLLREGESAPKLMTNISGIFPKKSPIGVYDKNILCRECEDRFEEWDDYGSRLLINELDTFTPLKQHNEIIGYQKEEYNYDKLKLFFISVLWRSSVSTHEFYRRVNLGPWEDRLSKFILDNNSGKDDENSVVLSLFVSSSGREKLKSTIMDPFREKWNGVNAYRVYFGGIVAYIKVDQRKLPQVLDQTMMRKNKPLLLVCRDLEKSNDVKAMIAVAKGGDT